jgi:hypothetical protein
MSPSRAQIALVRAATVLAALPFAAGVVAALVAEEDPGAAALWAGGAVIAGALAAAPLRFRGRFRLIAGAGALVLIAVGLWAILVGGSVLLPGGLLLGLAAAVPARWSLPRSLLAGVVAVAALYLVPFLLYGAYTCVRPAPVLDVSTGGTVPDGLGYSELAATDDGYRLEYDRGDGDRRDADARRLRGTDGVRSVRTSEERCD